MVIGQTAMWTAAGLLIATYAAIMTERINRAIGCVGGLGPQGPAG